MSHRRAFVRFVITLALATCATAAFADARCGEGMEWDGRSCVILVRGTPQRPQVFALTGRSALGWTAAEQRPQNHREAVVEATRRAPF
ncbi:MAG: hypothetical protein JNK05_26515 [Myxococcales bacterium]|nr:hypothetical protein [Myxococcales bacterium]